MDPERSCRRSTPTRRGTRSSAPAVSFGAYHAANFALKRADLFPLAICQSGVYDVSVVGGATAGTPSTSTTRWTTSRTSTATTSTGCAARVSLLLVCGQGQWEDTTGALESTKRFAGLLGEKGIPHELDLWGHDVPHDWPSWRGQLAHHLPRFALMAARHLIGLLLGTEEDWPAAFEPCSATSAVDYSGARTSSRPSGSSTSRSTCATGRATALVIDRLGLVVHVPREWLKKVTLMDDVYLLNNPFTFQAMEKHSAYCAMMRLGLRVPETWLMPHKSRRRTTLPADAPSATTPRSTSRRSARSRLPALHEAVRRRPVGRRHADRRRAELHAVYDESGERLMHLQAAVEDFDVFVRSLSIGAETMLMRFEPDRPLHDRYQIAHDFLTPELGDEVVTIRGW